MIQGLILSSSIQAFFDLRQVLLNQIVFLLHIMHQYPENAAGDLDELSLDLSHIPFIREANLDMVALLNRGLGDIDYRHIRQVLIWHKECTVLVQRIHRDSDQVGGI